MFSVPSLFGCSPLCLVLQSQSAWHNPGGGGAGGGRDAGRHDGPVVVREDGGKR